MWLGALSKSWLCSVLCYELLLHDVLLHRFNSTVVAFFPENGFPSARFLSNRVDHHECIISVCMIFPLEDMYDDEVARASEFRSLVLSIATTTGE